MPLKDTVVDFWRLLYEQQVSTIVMLNQLGSGKPKEVQNVFAYSAWHVLVYIVIYFYMFD